MSKTERTVQHLHLRGPTAQAMRQAVQGLEDAMRCASLPDAGERVLLVRQLHLGVLPASLSPQGMSVMIEQRVAAMGRSWVHGDDETRAARSDTVFFPSRLHAAKAALRRHALGERMDGWHWPLALPGVDVHARPSEFLAQLMDSVREWPEAPAAMAALAAHGHSEVLDWWTAYAPAEWRSIHLRSRVRREPAHEPVDHATAAQAPAGPRAGAAHRAADAGLAARVPRASASDPPTAAPSPSPTAERSNPLAMDRVGPMHSAARPGERQTPHTLSTLMQPPPPEWGFPKAGVRAQAESDAVAAPQVAVSVDRFARGAVLDTFEGIEPVETQAGGLLFLWPLLQRVGFVEWDAAHPDAWMAMQVLQLALQRTRVPKDDPAWALLASLRHAPHALPAPGSEPDSQAWLRRCRRYSRRVLNIGLASLVVRPARLRWSETHIDVHFHPKQADLRVRRAGLDIDFGWVDALQRVVGFHFDREDAQKR